MSASFPTLTKLLKDPPPEMVFEIAPECVRMARVAAPQQIREEPLQSGVVSPSPLHENIAYPEALNEAVARLLANSGRTSKRRSTAVLLPDHSAHVSVLDFDKLPDNADEQRSLIRFRLKRSVPFDIDTAALSYWVQDLSVRAKGHREVVVAVTAQEIIARYEAPFLLAGLEPGWVSLAPLASVDLVDSPGVVIIARLNGTVLTVMVLESGTLQVVRSIQLAEVALHELTSHLHQTAAYVEDQFASPPAEMLLAGFGDLQPDALRDFPTEFGVPVRVLGGSDTGIRGYLKGVA